jgi:hypothetical protein
MARGWESKEIESQIEAAEARASLSKKKRISAEQVQLQREREGLELSRTRVVQDLASAVNPKYREQLQRSLEHLDQKLAALKASASTPDRPE